MSSKLLFSKYTILYFTILNILFRSNLAQSVESLQFNTTELEWVLNDTIFLQFQNSFNLSITSDIEYCKDVLMIPNNSNYQSQNLTIFSLLLQNFLNHRCNSTSCAFSNYWNITTQNGIASSDFYQYITETLYLIFPMLPVVVTVFSAFSFLNCIYFNYCYCCCYRYKPRLNVNNTKCLFIQLVLFTILFILFGFYSQVLIISASSSLKEGYCQLINDNIYKLLYGNDFLQTNLTNNVKIVYPGWLGLNAIDLSVIDYVNNISSMRNSIIANPFVGENYNASVLSMTYSNLSGGVVAFQNYLGNSTFEEVDPNGETNPNFNMTYICSDCKNATLYKSLYDEFNVLIQWFTKIDNYLSVIHDNLVSIRALQENQNITSNIRISMYKTYKFYNNVNYYHTSVDQYFSFMEYEYLAFYVINAILLIVGCFCYFKIRKNIIYINSANEVDFSDPEKKKNIKVKYRWIFQVIVKCSIGKAISLSIYSFLLLIMTILLYEGDTVLRITFINQNLINLFVKVPNGDIINACMGQNATGSNLNSFLNISDAYNRIQNITTSGSKFSSDTQNFQIANFNNYTSLKNTINGFNLSVFHSINNSSYKWDMQNDEQINYFLFPLPNYQYVLPPPNETLIQYIDWNFQNPNFTNYQADWCTAETSNDVWISDFNFCTQFFPSSVNSANYTMNILDGNLYCISLTMPIYNQCLNQTDISCYVSNYMVRYSDPNDFSSCTVPQAELNSNMNSDSADYFRSKISNFLSLAKNEEILKNKLENDINTLQGNLEAMIGSEYLSFLTYLNEATIYLNSLYSNFIKIQSNSNAIAQGNNNITQDGILNITNCYFLNTNNLNLLYLFTNVVGGNFFSLSIFFSILAVLLFFNASIVVVMFFRLRTENELSAIKTYQNTVKALEAKELKFFFVPEDYIEEEDKDNLADIKKSKEGLRKNTFTRRLSEKHMTYKKNTLKMDELEKNEEEDAEMPNENMNKIKKFNALKRFTFHEAKERDERVNFRIEKKNEK